MKKGFSLIEILVVIAVIAVLTGISFILSNSARVISRDEQRRIDLQNITNGLVGFYSDCGGYLSDHSYDVRVGGPLVGVDWIADLDELGKKTCRDESVYMEKIPEDPEAPTRRYRYHAVRFRPAPWSWMVAKFVICASLENPPATPMDVSQCGGQCGTVACNYVHQSP